MDETCVTNPPLSFDGLVRGPPDDPYGQVASFASVGPSTTSGVLDLVDAFSDATATWDALVAERVPPAVGSCRLVALEREFALHFVRIHRNCLVARAAIRGFERAPGGEDEAHWLVVVDGVEERLPVSRRQWPQLRDLVT